jgi:chromosome segregation ATPase
MPAEIKDAPQRSIAEIEANYLANEVECLSEDTAREFSFADRVLRKILTENRQPNFTESTYFKSKLGWDQAKVNRERRRIETVARLQMVIGSAQQREELAKEKETATEIAEKEIGKLEQQIEKLSRQRNQLERAASSATRRCAEVEEALQRLRSPELLRTDVLENYNERLQHFGQTVQSRINALAIEIRHREACLSRPDSMDEQVWIRSIKSLAPQAVTRNTESTFAKYELNTNWADAQATMIEEIVAMKAEVDALESQRASFDEEQKRVAELYIEENN